MGKIVVKNANSEDWQKVKKIRLEALKKSPESFGASYEEEVNRSKKQWKERLDNKNRITIIALDKDYPVGIIGIRFETSPKIRHIAHIVSVYVIPSYRGKGISNALMELALKKIKGKRRIRKVTLNVVKEMIPAINLYKKFRFKVVGKLKDEMKVGKKYYESLVMELYLK